MGTHEHHGGGDKVSSIDDFLDSLAENATEAVKAVVTAATGAGNHDHHGHHGHEGHDHSAHSSPVSSGESNDHSGHDHGHAGHMMKMWFHGGFEEVVLFDFWRIGTWHGMLFSCILIFIMGAAYEGIKWFRVYLQMSQAANQKCSKDNAREVLPLQNCQNRNSSTDDVYNPTTTPPAMIRTNAKRSNLTGSDSAFSTARLTQATLYIVQLVLAYWLMLIVMTYNNYLTAAVILGAGFGHWLFAVLKFRSPLGETADSFATDACH